MPIPVFDSIKEGCPAPTKSVEYEKSDQLWTIKVDYALRGVLIIPKEGDKYSVRFPGSRSISSARDPDIEGEILRVALPYKAEIKDWGYRVQDFEILDGEFGVDPVLETCLEGTRPANPLTNPKAYFSSAWFPGLSVEFRDLVSIDGLRSLIATISPVSYKPVARKLCVAKDITLE